MRPVFYHEEITHCEMELLSIARGGHACVVELMNKWGHTLRADCLDALDTYMQYAAQHQKEAAVAAAFVRQGWQLTDIHLRESTLFLTRQQGESISVAVCCNTNNSADYQCHVDIIPLPETGTLIARLKLTPSSPGAPDSLELPCPPAGLEP